MSKDGTVILGHEEYLRGRSHATAHQHKAYAPSSERSNDPSQDATIESLKEQGNTQARMRCSRQVAGMQDLSRGYPQSREKLGLNHLRLACVRLLPLLVKNPVLTTVISSAL